MSFLPVNINIKHIKLNNVDHLGAVSFGSTIKQNRSVTGKKNQGFGQQLSDESLKIFSTSCVIDNEPNDSNSQKINR
ncbi:hypothetical protein DZB84_00445 [Bacillus sp. HNG]|uniref:hypothetical protein n=1 Tax=Bacillus sp. HNG TaxID=2293325 RepID=UPI000E2F870C|nr:hypothetical protein [Bacillus sp. HNG]RFB18757.1 hypothetical protein DZB84_00445 [Bacillus sp. HNG]